MTDRLILLVAVLAVTGFNVLRGYRWSRLDHNPWSGKPLNRNFSTPHPGFNPGKKSIEEIRAYGRTLMIGAPLGAAAFFAILLIASTRSA